jgi:hypothetical protein
MILISLFIGWAIPKKIPPPPYGRAPRKKDQSADAHTPSEIGKFLPYPSEKC